MGGQRGEMNVGKQNDISFWMRVLGFSFSPRGYMFFIWYWRWHGRPELLSAHREDHTSRAHSEGRSIQSLRFGWNDSGQTTAGLDPLMEVMFSTSVY